MWEKIWSWNIEQWKNINNIQDNQKLSWFKALSQIPEAKEQTNDSFESSKKWLENLKSDIEKWKNIAEIKKIGLKFNIDEQLLINGCQFLGENCNNEQITRIKNILITSQAENELNIKLQNFFDGKWFFTESKVLDLFEKKFKEKAEKDINKEEKDINKEEAEEKEKWILDTVINKIRSNPVVNNIFQKTFSEFSNIKNEEELKNKDIKIQTKFFKEFLKKLYQNSLTETDPDKKKELKQSFSSLCGDLKSAWIISNADIAGIIKLWEKEVGIKDESILEINWFRKLDEKENVFYKDEWKTNNIISIDENWQLNEKIGSNSSSYEVNINSSWILGEELDTVTKELLQVNFKLKEIEWGIKHHFESQEKLEKIIEILDRDPDSLKEEDLKVYEAYKDKKEDLKWIIKTVEGLKTKILDLEKRKIELEIEARNQDRTTEEYGLEKSLAKNKVEILDILGFTNTFSNENLDKLLEFLGRDEIKQILGFELDFSPERKKVTIEQLKKIFAKLLNSQDDQIYRNWTLNINYPYTEIKHNLEVLMQDPKILDGWILQFNWIKDRLQKESNWNTKL